MSWTGKIVGGIIGFLVFGPFGAALGIYFGHKFDKRQGLKPSETSNQIPVHCPHCNQVVYVMQEGLWNCAFCKKDFNYGKGPKQVESDIFLTLVFSMFAKLAKADGVVTKDEVEVVDKYAREVFHFNLEVRKLASNIFNEAKYNNRSFDDYARDYYEAYRSDYNTLINLIEGFLFISSIDITLHPNKEKLILKAVRIFNINQREYELLRARYFANNDKYYGVLGCSKSDSMEEIKRKYRKLVSEYHPDKIIAKNLPEDFISFANQRFKEIQEAYEYVRKDKQAS